MVLPVGDDAGEQIGAAQERAVGRRDAAEHDVIAAAGADMTAVEHELLGAEAEGARPPRRRSMVISTASSQETAGCTLTSITPGSGVTLMLLRRGSKGGS